jgi:hypothetical protein
MDMVYPVDLLRRLGRRNIEIDNDGLLIIADDDTGKRFVLARINLLVGNERWHVDEVTRPSFGNEFKARSPPHPRPAIYHVDHALQFPMVMGTGFSVGVDRDGTRPQLVCAGRGMRDGRRTRHTRRLGSIEIQFVTSDYPNSVKAPVGCRFSCHLAIPFLTNPCYFDYCVIVTSVSSVHKELNRTLVYGLLTAFLGLLYFGGVTATQATFQALTGQQQLPLLTIVASTLVIAALFNPLRRRIQSFIDRRFYRSKYDARKTLETFSARLRDETDLEALSEDLVGLVRDTMQPAYVSLWLRSTHYRRTKE